MSPIHVGALVVLLAACSKPAPEPIEPAPTETAPTRAATPTDTAPTANAVAANGWPAHLAALRDGARFSLIYEDGGTNVTIVATVAAAGSDAFELTWSKDGAPFDDGMPTRIERDGDVISVAGTAFDDPDSASGAIIERRGDVVCYTDGPAADAGDCNDICYSSACFHPKRGLVQLSGNWAPLQFSAIGPRCSDATGAVVCK